MQRFLSLPLAAIFAAAGFLPLARAVEQAHPGKPLLWKIEGEGLEKPSFLFGISYPPLPEGIQPAVEAAFTSCDIFETAVALDEESQQKSVPLFTRTDGQTLAEALDAELLAALTTRLKLIDPGFEPGHFKNYKTWVVAWFLPDLKLRLMRVEPVDGTMGKRASKAGKEIRALTTSQEQLAFFNSLPEPDQQAMLEGQISSLRKDQENGFDSREHSMELYRAGDESAILQWANSSLAQTLTDHPDLLGRMRKAVIEDGNSVFSEAISANLTASPGKSHFIALPVGHIIAEQGVRDRLAASGYRITRINN